jgi:glyoxylase-like metal-dependent hydrolase (beta-lactamase superfamily II)
VNNGVRIGQWQVDWFEDVRWRIDGGAMFGRVPRVLWEKDNPPDEQNRIEVTCRPLLLRSDDGTVVLIDTGLGTTYNAKLRRNFAIPEGNQLIEGLARFDITPDNVSYVVLTHLHFDHVGGAVRKNESGAVVPTFPNARHLINRGEWELAHTEHPVIRRQYNSHTFGPLANAGLVDLTDEGEILPGVTVETTGGHTYHHQMVLVSDSDTTLCYPGDAMPQERTSIRRGLLDSMRSQSRWPIAKPRSSHVEREKTGFSC